MTQTQDAPGPQSCATEVPDAVGEPVTVHITGFEPFGGADSNASWEAVRLLPGTIGLAGGSAPLTRDLLPVAFTAATAAARSVVGRLRPDVVVHVGEQAGARTVVLETTAYNEATARIPDNTGLRPTGEALVPGGAPLQRTTWPAAALVGRLSAAGLPVARSDDAGRYVCNATLYAALDAASHLPEAERPVIGFVHVPPPKVMAPQTVAEVLRLLIVELADLVRRRRTAKAGIGRLRVPRGGRVLRVGLTGGIGSGKSTVARLLAARGARVVDADAIAREVVEPGSPALAAIVAAFGTTVLTADGALDRAALAGRVFTDPGARGVLEAITLPCIAQAAAQRMEAAGPGGVAVYDVPLLVEQGMVDLFDCVVVVEAPFALRIAHLEERGLSREEAESRMASQADDEERRRIADVLLLNNGTREDLADGVDWLWEHRLAAAAAG